MAVNPYVADRPVYPGEAQVPREELYSEISQALEERGGLSVLFGLRRVGKTSFLYKAIDRWEAEKKVLPIYVNCIVFEREEPWGTRELFGTIAQVVRSYIPRKKLYLSRPMKVPEEGFTGAEFKIFMDKVLELMDKKILIVFDDAGVFGESIPDSGEPLFGEKVFQTFWDTLRSIAYGPGSPEGFFALFSLEKWNPLWEQLEVPALHWRIELLSRQELRELLRQGALEEYTPEAFEYLWEVTGGHPSLAQLIWGNVIRLWEGDWEASVPRSHVEEAVENLLQDEALQGFFWYLYRYSFSSREREVLEKGASSGTYSSLSLETKQVLERDGTLRIDFFRRYLESRDESRDGDDS